MLSAQKALLQASVQEQGAQLQSQELQYFSANFSMISTMASVIAGFAFSGLLIGPDYDGPWLTTRKSSNTNSTVIGLYYGFASTAIGLCLLSCIICTVINVRGAGLALRGPDGSLKRAVDSMRLYQRCALVFLSFGVISFHIEGMLYAWLELELQSTVVVVTTVLSLVLVVMMVLMSRIVTSLAIVRGQLIAGELTDAQLTAVVRRLSGRETSAGGDSSSYMYGAAGHTAPVVPEEGPPPLSSLGAVTGTVDDAKSTTGGSGIFSSLI